MPSKSWDRYADLPYLGKVSIEYYRASGDNSPRSPSGKLILRANAYSKQHGKNLGFSYDGKGATIPSLTNSAGSSSEAVYASEQAWNEAYSRLRGKLYKGSASLGVTAASYRQSREMIVKNATSIVRTIAVADKNLRRRWKFPWYAPKKVADRVLEVMFGWKPLLEDIHNSCSTVIQLADRLEAVNGRGMKNYYVSYESRSSDGKRIEKFVKGGTAKATSSCLVYISNPNRWLLERAGLLNPAAVAWDLVPWSFVVNMFANTGSLVNSITDFAGLTFNNLSDTRTWHEGGVLTNEYHNSGTFPGPWRTDSVATATYVSDKKQRFVGVSPRPSLVTKLPGVDWQLAAIAASLMTQQVYRFSSWISHSGKQ